MGIVAKLGKLANLTPAKIGLFRYSDPNYLNLHFANGARVSLREWQGLYAYYSSDHLFESGFAGAFDEAMRRQPSMLPEAVRLRIFNTVKFGEVALRLDGDVMFCGVSHALAAYTFAKLNHARLRGRTMFFVDSFEGAYSSADRRPRPEFGTDAQEICGTFSRLGRVEICCGYIPEALLSSSIDNKLCFVHMDTTDPVSEVASLDWISERMVNGGIVLIDAFSMSHAGSDKYLAKLTALGFIVIPLMNGQAVCFKG